MGYIFEALNRAETERRPAAASTGGRAASGTLAATSAQPAVVTAQAKRRDPSRQQGERPDDQRGIAARLLADATHLDDRLVTFTDATSPRAEEYRAIRTTLLARRGNHAHSVSTITSATPQEGKTITTLNLGLSLAELQPGRTICIEADLRLPTFANLLRTNPAAGLLQYLQGEADLDQIITGVEPSGLHVIPAGGRTDRQAVQLISSSRMAQLIEALRSRYEHVLIDTPPVVELADAGVLGAMSDDVIMVVRMNRTPRSLVEQALRTLASYNAPVAGLIATDQTRFRQRYYSYRYGYHRAGRAA